MQIDRMKRREFITLLGSAMAAWPLPLNAQQSRMPRIGVLLISNPEQFWSMFREGLRDHGYVDGQNIQLEFRSADGRAFLLPELAAELVRLKVDIIVANQTPAAQTAKQATSEIPIVITAGDPIGTGLVTSLARPGGNITGISSTTAELGGKLLELIREVLPLTRRVAVLANATDPFTKPFLEQIELGGRTLGIAIQTVMVRGTEEFEAAFVEMHKTQADAVIIQPSLQRRRAVELALRHRLPPISPTRPFPAEGGLMSYSANQHELYKRAAFYVDRILKGAKPAELPIEQPIKFELVINLKTAKALGLEISPTLLARADEVIE